MGIGKFGAGQKDLMAKTHLKSGAASVHRVDLPCSQTGFLCPPPYDVHIKFLPNLPPLEGWTLLAHAAAGKPDPLSSWLAKHPDLENIRVEPGLAPKLLRATTAKLPALWAAAASFAKVHHLDLTQDGSASWFIEGDREQVLAFVNDLEERQQVPLSATEVRVRPVHDSKARAPISRRQFEALTTAVSLGYYEIPHRLDLRALASRTGVSLGSLSELLRRAEAAVLTHYVDRSLMGWPATDEPPNPFRPVEEMLQPVALANVGGRGRHSRPSYASNVLAARPAATERADWPLTRH